MQVVTNVFTLQSVAECEAASFGWRWCRVASVVVMQSWCFVGVLCGVGRLAAVSPSDGQLSHSVVFCAHYCVGKSGSSRQGKSIERCVGHKIVRYALL